MCKYILCIWGAKTAGGETERGGPRNKINGSIRLAQKTTVCGLEMGMISGSFL